MSTHLDKDDLIHQLIIRRAEQEKRRIMLEQGYDDSYCCGMCKRKNKSTINVRRLSRKQVAPLDTSHVEGNDRDQVISLHEINSASAVASSDAELQSQEDIKAVTSRKRFSLNQRSEFLDDYEIYLDSVLNRKEVPDHLDTYDPYEHRRQKKLSTWGAINHIIRSMMGVGVIKMPKVYKENGLLNGVTVTIAFVTVASFTMHIMLITRNKICTKLNIPWLSFGNTVKEAFNMGPVRLRKFSNCAKYIIEACVIIKRMILNMFLVRFLILFIKKIYYKTYEDRIPPDSILPIFFIVPLTYVSLLRNLRKLVFHSVLGNFILIVTITVITYHTSSNLEDITLRSKDINFFSLIEFLNIGIIGLDSMELGYAVESRMQYPKSFMGIVGAYNIGLVFSTVLVLLIGVLGYWKFGENIQVFLFDNLPLERNALIIFTIAYTVMLSSTFALHLYLPYKMIWRSYFPKSIHRSKYKVLWKHYIKLSLTLITILISFFSEILRRIAIVIGVALMPLISFTLPMILHLLVIHKVSKKWKVYYVIRNIIIIILSVGLTVCFIIQISLCDETIIAD